MTTPQSSPRSKASSAESLFNQGTGLLKAGDAASARAFLEKAHQLRPDVQDIRVNLQLARNELAQKIGISQLDPATPDWAPWVRPAGLTISGPVLSLALLLGVLSLWQQLKRERFLDFSAWVRSPLLWTALLLTGVAVTTWMGNQWLGRHPFAVALQPLEIKSGPGSRFVDLGRIPPGAGLRLTGESRSTKSEGGWIQILHRGREPGWISDGPGRILVVDPEPQARAEDGEHGQGPKDVAKSRS